MAFVPEGQADSSQVRSALTLRASAVWTLGGALGVIYAPKVATGLSPGFRMCLALLRQPKGPAPKGLEDLAQARVSTLGTPK
jgi:hypothetical protein